MGLLSVGNPLSWEETKKLSDHVRKHGIIQFINQYHKLKDRQGDVLKWGDEIEFMLVKFNHKEKTAKLSLRAHELLPILQQPELTDPQSAKSLWRPEYGNYALEGLPGQPFELAHFNSVEANMRYRRKVVKELLQEGEEILSITCFPRLGCESFSDPHHLPTPDKGNTRSLFIPEDTIYTAHPRFYTCEINTRSRRGENVAINVPIYKDKYTKIPVDESYKVRDAAKSDHIYMDSTCFGMGLSCLQVTFQASNIDEARILYDQLAPLTPIMLALTAASPIYRGFLADVDCRWNILSCALDDRTKEERGLAPLQNDRFVINKSRYDSISSYLSSQGEPFNDIPLVYDTKIYDQLKENNIDHLLAQHIAHLFIRDSIILFDEKINQNDEQDTDHFENIQSTNWQSLRFKLPPPNTDIGWRIEFRPCELQITDFENAAFACFIVLATRVILSFQLNFLIPISKVDENMKNAQKRNAVLSEKFWFRKESLMTNGTFTANTKHRSDTNGHLEESTSQAVVLMTIDEIINGKKDLFPGLIPLIKKYLSSIDLDADTNFTIEKYLNFIGRRASGEILTTASWIRKFVTSHSNYKFDSAVSERINYDLLKEVNEIQCGEKECFELFGTNSNV